MAVMVAWMQALRSVWMQPARQQQECDRLERSGTRKRQYLARRPHLRCAATTDPIESASEEASSSSSAHAAAARQRGGGSATASGAASGGRLVRRASTSDLEQLCVLEDLTAEEGSTWSRRQVEAELTRERATVLVVDGGSGPVAWAVGWDVPGELHILNVACHPDHRRQGHARALLIALIEMHGQAEVAQLEVRVSNEAALRLYDSLGFERVGRRKKYYQCGEDAVLMNLGLQSATQ